MSSGPTYSTIHKYAFDQSKKFVKIYITLPGIEDLDDSKVRLEVGNGDELVFEVVGLPKPGPPNVRLAARELFSPVDPTQCTWARKSDSMILLKLRKKEEGEEWGSLDDSARIAAKRKEEKLVENKGKSTQGACVLRVPSPPPCKWYGRPQCLPFARPCRALGEYVRGCGRGGQGIARSCVGGGTGKA